MNSVIQNAAITILGLVSILLIKHAKRGVNSWTGIGLSLAIICYLLVDTNWVQTHKLFFYIILTAAINIPVLFFMLSKALFDDHFKQSYWIGLWFLIQIIPHFHIYLKGEIYFDNSIQQLLSIAADITGFGFVLGGLYMAIKTKKGDLIESRLRFRTLFIIITASLIGITLLVESIPLERESTEMLQVLQRASIFVLTVYFLLNNVRILPGFFFKEYQAEKPSSVPKDNSLRLKLEALIEHQKIYSKEGLTIRELSEIMSEQEYRVRRLINGELGFRNFNDFLNQYRVKEACHILSDPSQNRKTILEIAYGLGYQSIGPFNKAFKEQTNTSPTTFRKNAQKI